MSHITSSTFSPPSVIGSDSIDSEVVSIINLGSDEAPKLHVPENYKGDKVFELGDGDIDIQVNGVIFQTHKYLLKRFDGLKARLERKSSERSDKPLTLERENGAEDFLNTFKVLYATPLEGSIDFDHPTLTSALRIATAYGYPALRKFAITGLEKASLSAIERIRIAREFRLTSWEEPAYVELCERDEAITEQEANILGIGAFVQVAKIREKEQRRKGRDIDEWEGDEAENNDAHLCNPQARDISLLATPKVETTPVLIFNKNKNKKSTRTLENGTDNITTGSSTSKEEPKALEQNKNLCFVNAPKPRSTSYHSYGSNTLEVEVPGCKCVSVGRVFNQVLGRYINPGEKCICKISPCAADAFENLQAQQHTQADSITKLESTIQDIRTTLVTPKPHTIQSGPSLFNSNESTSVRIDVRSWLSLGV